MTEADRYWLAGLLEGEGSFLKGSPSRPNRLLVSLQMCDADVVEHAASMMGNRPVNRYHRRSKPWTKPVFATRVNGFAAAELMRELYPLMGGLRRRQIQNALASYRGPTRSPLRPSGCAADGCDLRAHARGLCRRHYLSYWDASRRGRPSPIQPVPRPETPGVEGLAPRFETGTVGDGVSPDGPARAWLAGLLEGEGTFSAPPPSSPNDPRVSIHMCDREIIERSAQLVGGRPIKTDDRGLSAGWQVAYVWVLGGGRGARLMRELSPLLGERRRSQIDRALASYQGPLRLSSSDVPPHCVTDDCSSEHRSRGLCHRHYMSWHRDRKRGREPRVKPLR